MRILYLSQYFPPEVGATQTRAYEMARGLVQAGHQVTMLAEVPNHPSGIIPPAYRGKWFERSDLDGIDVLRVWVLGLAGQEFSLAHGLLPDLHGKRCVGGRFAGAWAV